MFTQTFTAKNFIAYWAQENHFSTFKVWVTGTHRIAEGWYEIAGVKPSETGKTVQIRVKTPTQFDAFKRDTHVVAPEALVKIGS